MPTLTRLALYFILVSGSWKQAAASNDNDKECRSNEFVPFYQMVVDLDDKNNGPVYVDDKENMSEKEISNTKFVLDFYKLPYKTIDGSLYIECKLQRNYEKRANITLKSKDSDWIERQKILLRTLEELKSKRRTDQIK